MNVESAKLIREKLASAGNGVVLSQKELIIFVDFLLVLYPLFFMVYVGYNCITKNLYFQPL
jgi:hypothetical protein